MATETLNIPEEHLKLFIEVVRNGIKVTVLPREVRKVLKKWCDDEEEYLQVLEEAE